MEHLLLSLHVLAGILFIGPVAVTTSMFPRFAADAAGGAEAASPGAARILHRITRSYGMLALAVPLVGMLLAAVQGRLTEVWIIAAMALTAVAGALLVLRITPMQRDALEMPGDTARLRTLRILSGVFNLLWASVVVLMIVRPGAA